MIKQSFLQIHSLGIFLLAFFENADTHEDGGWHGSFWNA